MNEFVAYPSRWRLALLFIVALGFVVVGLGLVGTFGAPWVSRRVSPVVGMVGGWICLAFSGTCAVSIGRSFLDVDAELRIGPQGIWWSQWSVETNIPWFEITNVTTWQYKGQKFIRLRLQDATRFPARGFMGWAGEANRALPGGSIDITFAWTDRSANEAMAAIKHYRQ